MLLTFWLWFKFGVCLEVLVFGFSFAWSDRAAFAFLWSFAPGLPFWLESEEQDTGNHNAILANFHRAPRLLAKERVEFVKKYTALAKELKAEELKLRYNMPDHIRVLMKEKRLALWGRMLTDLQYPDVDLIQDICRGFL